MEEKSKPEEEVIKLDAYPERDYVILRIGPASLYLLPEVAAELAAKLRKAAKKQGWRK